MNIQSLSISVPPMSDKKEDGRKCVNDCRMCVSNMREDKYPNYFSSSDYDGENITMMSPYHLTAYVNRMEYARDNGCNVAMLTGTLEPQQNRGFLKMFGKFNKRLSKPFRNIEMQTTGVLIDSDYLLELRDVVGVSTISMSLNSFDNEINANICQTNPKLMVNIHDFCSSVKSPKMKMNLRLSLNLNNTFESMTPKQLFEYASQTLGADQVTLRVLYSDGKDTIQSKWVEENRASDAYVKKLKDYVMKNGKPLEKLPFGFTKYSLHGMGVVIDSDCMANKSEKQEENAYKYLILRENCKLYSRWDDDASLIF